MNPKFTLSKSKVLKQYHIVSSVADMISYSSKTNSLVTQILGRETDCLFSIHLINELKNVEDKSRVLFLAQAWDEEQIKQLTEQGINKFVIDNEVDLDTLIKFLESNDVRINLLLRLKLKENTLRTEKYFVFGMTSDIIIRRIRELKNHPRINQLGIHFHRKTQNLAEWNYAYELSQIFPPDVFESIQVINMGGGLPSEYANTNVNVFPGIFTKITEFKSWLREKEIKLILEPGRFIAAPAGKLHTTIIAIYDNNIIINASVYNSDMDALIVPVKLLVEGELTKEEATERQGKPYVIKGITPCSLDLFRYRVYLNNPKVGDRLVFLNAGAYNFTADFCDLEKIETEIVE